MMGSSLYPDRLWISLVWIWTILLTADGSSMTWYEPLPIQTVSDTDIVDHLGNSAQLLEGSINASLSWNFSLSSDLSFTSLTISLGGTIIAGVVSSGPGVQAGFKEKFDIRWIPFQRVTLIIFNVTTEVNGTFSCTVTATKGFGTAIFGSNIQVHVVVPPEIDYLSSNLDVCENTSVILSCNATGEPTPSITWKRVADDSAVILPSVHGGYVLKNTNIDSSGQYRCTASNGVGVANKTLNVTVRLAASIDQIVNSSNTVIEGKFFSITCNASGDPSPTNYTWINKDGQVFNGSVLRFINISRDEAGQYRCEVENRCGVDSRNTTVNVFYPPNITFISLNQTVNESNVVLLSCEADGSPEPNITWTRLPNNSIVSMPLTITGKQDEGGYRCTADNGVGNATFSDVFITVEYYSPIKTVFSTNFSKDTVDLNDIFNLTCSADANPAAKYRLYRGEESLVNITDGQSSGSYLTFVNNRTKQVTYRCIPFNFFGDGPTKTITVTVHYPPIITSISLNQTVVEGDVLQLICTADGNPEPSITWTRLSNNHIVRMPLDTIEKQDEGGYTCTADNGIGNSASSDVFITVKGKPTSAAPTFTGKPTKQVHCEMTILANYTEVKQVLKPLRRQMDKTYENDTNYDGNEVTGTRLVNPSARRSGIIVIFILFFKNAVTPSQGISRLRAAISDGKFGDYKVEKLILLSPGTSTSTTPRASKPTDNEGLWTIIGAVAGSVVLVAFVVALVTWWVHKKRKCIKDTKIHNSECEESLHGDSPNAKVNRAYAESGPPSASGTQQSQDLGAIPTYAVVDKSKKKKKKEEKPPIYATVDKSKKRKKKTDDKNLYDNVEEPKKERKPGEVLYAELGDFQNPAMPEVSTSPATLPPLRRPPSYEQTQYADITAFLKGDATLPQKEGNEGSEMQEQGANQSQHDVDNKETPIQEDSPCSRVNGAYAKSGPPSANSTDVSSAAQKQPAQEAGAIPTYAVVAKSKKKKKEPEEMPLVNTDKGNSKKKKKKTDDKNLYDSVEEPKKEKKPGEIFYADLGEFQKQEMPKVATSPPTLPPLKRAPSYEKTDYADITQFLRKEATLPKVATSPPTLPPIKRAPSYEKTGYAEKEATLPPEKTPNSEMKPQAANQTHDEVENKETAL